MAERIIRTEYDAIEGSTTLQEAIEKCLGPGTPKCRDRLPVVKHAHSHSKLISGRHLK
jgi:hypothetical protein